CLRADGACEAPDYDSRFAVRIRAVIVVRVERDYPDRSAFTFYLLGFLRRPVFLIALFCCVESCHVNPLLLEAHRSSLRGLPWSCRALGRLSLFVRPLQ